MDHAAAHDLLEALVAAVAIAEEAREEWDKAPSGMRAGKILIALSGGCPGYRADIDAIHAAIAKARGIPAYLDQMGPATCGRLISPPDP